MQKEGMTSSSYFNCFPTMHKSKSKYVSKHLFYTFIRYHTVCMEMLINIKNKEKCSCFKCFSLNFRAKNHKATNHRKVLFIYGILIRWWRYINYTNKQCIISWWRSIFKSYEGWSTRNGSIKGLKIFIA